MIFIYLIFMIVLIETCLVGIVKYFRREFQWLITESDECPKLDQNALKRFFMNGYDSRLGWVRKANTSGIESGRCGQTKYTIDPRGARLNPVAGRMEETIATIGDSYTFCRQVNDDETWQVYLSRKLDMEVSNYGVGNYGVDQAILRYEQTGFSPSVKIVILGFVPENICRIRSYWKHYLEFGNTFAFKPRFMLDGKELILLPNVMRSEEDFASLADKLPYIQKNDYFYSKKFRKLQFRFPYIVSYFRDPGRNFRLIKGLFVRKLANIFGKRSPHIENAPFRMVMEYNIKQSHEMYTTSDACELLKAILQRFRNAAVKKGHKPMILVMPQLIDLKMIADGSIPYSSFFREVGHEMPVVDLTGFLLANEPERLYTEDLYGGHFSKEGNAVVAGYLADKLRGLLSYERAGELREKR